jgi:hypothetical protein
MLILPACYKQKDKSFIDIISEQPTNNTAYCYVVNSDKYILRDDIAELVEFLQPQNWKSAGKASDEKNFKDVIINFNEFPEGKNEKNFDYSKGTYVIKQLVIQTESRFVFDGYSTEGEKYLLNNDIVTDLQAFIAKKAVSNAELIKRMK